MSLDVDITDKARLLLRQGILTENLGLEALKAYMKSVLPIAHSLKNLEYLTVEDTKN